MSSNPVTQITSTVDLVKAYAKQETVGRLKGIGRWVGFGIVGATALAIGIVLLVVGLLRLMQDLWEDTFDGVLVDRPLPDRPRGLHPRGGPGPQPREGHRPAP